MTDPGSVAKLRENIGVDVDILINNSEVHGTYGIAAPSGVAGAQAEMDVNYFGLLRLAQEFGPAMCSRTSGGSMSLRGWINVLSIYALANFPAHGTFSASKAAAHSLAQCLRSEMHANGVRVVNVFPGPIDCAQNEQLPTPKLAPAALAKAILVALNDGVEDAYPGDVAQYWLAGGVKTQKYSNVSWPQTVSPEQFAMDSPRSGAKESLGATRHADRISSERAISSPAFPRPASST